ncbi:chaperonin 10-like protein [Mycena floridula]|nr:chaperonin 10-like protein [Mycena floridula]
MSEATTHRAIRWYPPSFDIRVESLELPRIVHSDDAIVKVTLAALCGSDLHVYRGHGGVDKTHTCGHEFIGQVVKLGSSFGPDAANRPSLYSTLKVGDKVVAPFTVNCGECHVCRLGYTCRCPSGALFGSPALEGGQAQYIRVPKAGGTLFNLSNPSTFGKSITIDKIADSSLLLLADILPTGVFAAIQALNHPKVLPVITGLPWPSSFFPNSEFNEATPLQDTDRILTLALLGLGPVGICASISLLDMLCTKQIPFRIVAIDPLASRREKMQAIYEAIPADGTGTGEFLVQSADDAKATVTRWTSGIGCSAVVEVVGSNSALTLAYDLVQPFGAIVSVGVHGAPEMPFTGRQLYNKNISFDFGRCPARAMFSMAFDLLVKRQDIFGTVGNSTSLVDCVVGFDQAKEMYAAFEKGEIGKVVFDPWK